MAIELVTGHTGQAHVTAAQDGRRNVGTFGREGRYVLDTGQGLSLTADSANQVTVGTGDAIMDGRHVCAETPTQLQVASGAQGQKRNDLVVLHYTDVSGVESVEVRVLQGTPSSSTPTDPAWRQDSITDGATEADWPLWRLPLDGITLGIPEPMFEVSPTLASLAAANEDIYDELAKTGSEWSSPWRVNTVGELRECCCVLAPTFAVGATEIPVTLPFTAHRWDSYAVFLSLMNDQGANMPYFNKIGLASKQFTTGGFVIYAWNDAPVALPYRLAVRVVELTQ